MILTLGVCFSAWSVIPWWTEKKQNAKIQGADHGWLRIIKKVMDESGGGYRTVTDFWKGNSVAVLRAWKPRRFGMGCLKNAENMPWNIWKNIWRFLGGFYTDVQLMFYFAFKVPWLNWFRTRQLPHQTTGAYVSEVNTNPGYFDYLWNIVEYCSHEYTWIL